MKTPARELVRPHRAHRPAGENAESADYISYGVQRIILLMIQRSVAAIAFLLSASFMVAQTALSPTVQFPRLKITFGEGVPLNLDPAQLWCRRARFVLC
jgi:hypothetical protein